MKLLESATLLFILLTLVACGLKEDHAHETVPKYSCSMHPQVIRDHPGKCPICGMDLVPLNASGSKDGSVMLGESQIKLGNITTTLTRYENFESTVVLSGKLVVDEEQTEVISCRVQGRIERLYFKESGQRVEQGQPLYQIYSEQLLTLQQEYLLVLNQFKELGQLRSEIFLNGAEKKLLLIGMTKNQVQQLAKSRTIEPKITFVSPVTGVIVKIDAVEGQYMEEGGPLFRIEKLDRLWVEAEVYGDEEKMIRTGDTVKVAVSGFENTPSNGRVTFLSPEYRNGSQIITLRAVIRNPKRELSPGMQADVILINGRKSAIALPVDAVIHEAKGNHVWVLTQEGAFKPRMVETGLENSFKVEITRGLNENENVVITGAYLLYGELVLKKGGDPMAGHQHNN